MRRLLAIGLVGSLGLAVAACGDDDDMVTPDAVVLPIDASVMPDAPPANPDAQVGDGNDSFGQAVTVPKNDQDGITGAIDEPDDKDYFKFTGQAGWTAIDIEANGTDDPMKVDIVITLFDSTMTQIAQNDDAIPRVNTDSEILIRLPAAGMYYIEVQEFSDWANSMPEGEASFIYRLTVFDVDPAAFMGIVAETEPNDDAAGANAVELLTDAMTNTASSLLLGGFAAGDAADVWSFTIPAGQKYFSLAVMPHSEDGYGSTAAVGRAYVTDAAGTTVFARIAPGPLPSPTSVGGPWDMSPPLPAGEYRLFVEPAAGYTPGANDFWVGKYFTGPTDNDPEAEVGTAGTNDTLATAEARTLNSNGVTYVLAHLSSDTDVDYFSVPAAAGTTVSVFCGSASAGSGVMGFRAEVRGADDAVIKGANENAVNGLQLTEAAAAAGGTSYVRLSKTSQDATVTGDWARCGIVVE